MGFTERGILMDTLPASPTPLPSLAPSAAPSPLPVRRSRRPTLPGDIGWGLKMTENDFLREVEGKEHYGRKMGLHFTHIPAEMKREYFLNELQGSQTLPSPSNIDSAPASPVFDRRFYRRNGSGTSAPSDLAALRSADQILQTQRTFDRRIAPLSPTSVRPSTSVSSFAGHSKLGPSPRQQNLRYKGMGVMRGHFGGQSYKSHSSSGSSTPGFLN